MYLVAAAVFRRDALRVRTADVPLFLGFGGVALAGVQLTYYESIARLPIGVALVIQYLAPLLLLVYARARGRRVGRALWLAAVLAVGGCYLVVGAYDTALLGLDPLGLAIAVLSTLFFALYFVLAERISRAYGTTTLLVWGFGAALAAWTLVRPPWLLPWTATGPETYALIGMVVVLAGVIPFALTLLAVRFIPAARVALTATFEPVVAGALAWLVLQETLEVPQLAGGALVLAGIATAQALRPDAGSV